MTTLATSDPQGPSPAEVAQILEDAADILLVHGRCLFSKKDSSGRYCVVGALSQAEYGNPHQRPSESVARPLGRVLPPLIIPDDGGGGHPVVQAMAWSDMTEDDFEVIDTLRRVAKDIRNEAQP